MINAGLWHEARVFSTAHILTEGIKAPQLEGKLHQQRQIGIDKLHVILNPSLHYD
jgi:diaminohydroxyphosphoribosylaminopyrimidine deaminase/5-amino-6-(5-phosphoribosylamino)uracil reductase